MYPLNADYEGVQYAAEYDFVDDDTIVILFPDGTQSHEIPLRGLKPLPTARIELRAYASKLKQR
jgi:hypothetical protein